MFDKKKIGNWLKDNFIPKNTPDQKHKTRAAKPPPKESKPNDTPKQKTDILPQVNSKPLLEKRNPEKEFLKKFKQLTHSRSSWEAWSDFIVMSACSISNAVDKSHYDEREELYLKTIRKYKKEEQEVFPQLLAETVMALDANPEQDFLGKMYMNLELGNRRNGQFFTPYHISGLMAKMSLDNIVDLVKKQGYVSIADTCCGGGAMLIAGINEARALLEKEKLNFQNHVLVVGQDIDSTVALMCYIQISLLGVAGYVKIGNSLTEPISLSDTLENYWFTPMYFSEVWNMRRIFRGENL